MSKTLTDINFTDLLPASIAGDPIIQAAACSIDGELNRINRAIDSLHVFTRWDELEEPLLTHLAWQFKVDFWEDDLPIDKKRTLVKHSLARHRQKGTPSAIEEAIGDVLGGGIVEEWWEYNGAPYHFRVRVDVTDQGVTERSYEWADRLIEAYKNVRSKLDGVITYLSGRGQIRMAMGCQSGESGILLPWHPKDLTASGAVYVAVGTQMIENVTIEPFQP